MHHYVNGGWQTEWESWKHSFYPGLIYERLTHLFHSIVGLACSGKKNSSIIHAHFDSCSSDGTSLFLQACISSEQKRYKKRILRWQIFYFSLVFFSSAKLYFWLLIPPRIQLFTWRFGIHVSSSIKYEHGQCSWDLGPWFGCFRSSNDHVCLRINSFMNKHHHHCNKSYVLHVWNLYLHVPGKVAKQLKNYTKHCDAPPPSNNGK